MGLGDDIMSTAFVDALLAQFPKASFVMGEGEAQTIHWSEVFENNPHMLQKGASHDGELVFIPDYPGKRAYIDYERSKATGRFAFNEDFKAPVGKIYFSDQEKDRIEDLKKELGQVVIIEPNVKDTCWSVNKDWGFNMWRGLTEVTHGKIRWLQIGEPARGRILPGVWKRPTARFRGALCVLAASRGFVGTDSALHHAAAALGKPAVVVWGGYSSPKHLGYDVHLNVVPMQDGRTPCGSLSPCYHCSEMMGSINLPAVEKAVLEAFG